MAHCPQLQIDRAFALWKRGMVGHDDPIEKLDRRALKRGWDSGYTMGEDAGFDRGWAAAEWHFRPWWLKLWHRLRHVPEPPQKHRWADLSEEEFQYRLKY